MTDRDACCRRMRPTEMKKPGMSAGLGNSFGKPLSLVVLRPFALGDPGRQGNVTVLDDDFLALA